MKRQRLFFHVTDKKNIRSIKRHGLVPRKNRPLKQGDKQVWLIREKTKAENIVALKRHSRQCIKNPILLALNLTNMRVHRYTHSTWLFPCVSEYYTMQAVAPSRIVSIMPIESEVA